MVRLIILGLLNLRPMSGYAIQQYLQLNQVDKWSDILPGSIYHALKKLMSEGFIALKSTEQTGMRTKAIYAITEPGQAEFRALLRDAWRTPPHSLPGDLYMILGFIDDLPRDEVLAALDEQIVKVRQQLATWNAGAVAKEKAIGFLPEIIRASFDNGRAHMEADLEFLQILREQLPKTPPLNRNFPIEEE